MDPIRLSLLFIELGVTEQKQRESIGEEAITPLQALYPLFREYVTKTLDYERNSKKAGDLKRALDRGEVESSAPCPIPSPKGSPRSTRARKGDPCASLNAEQKKVKEVQALADKMEVKAQLAREAATACRTVAEIASALVPITQKLHRVVDTFFRKSTDKAAMA